MYTSSSMSNSLRIYMDKEKHQNFISWPFCKMSVGLCNIQNAIYKNTIMRTYKIGLQALKLPCILDKLSICGSSKYHMISKLCQGYFNAIISKIPNERDKMASLTCQSNMTRKNILSYIWLYSSPLPVLIWLFIGHIFYMKISIVT